MGSQLPTSVYNRILVNVSLNSGTKPSWSTHDSGFSVNLDLASIGSGWGTTSGECIIYADTYSFCSVSPASYTQLTYGSIPVLYLRGGGKYFVKTDFVVNWTPKPTGYTWQEGNYKQTAPVLDSRPVPSGTNIKGKSTYFHIKYSAVSNPTTSNQMTEIPNTYIGTYVDFTQEDSTDPKKYTWSRFQGLQGPQGTQGIPGTNGTNGKTSYLHIKYSNDGGKTFTGNSGEDVGTYIGTCVDYNQSDPASVGSYKWAKIKGEQGATGATGATGPSGIIVSSTAPSNPKVGQLWQTASGQPIKRWDGSRWVIHYIAVENLDVQTLSAIVANLGTVTAGLIKSKGGHFYINVDTGEIVSKSSDGTISVFVKKENIDMVRSFTASRYWGSRLNYSGLEFYSGGSSMADDIANGSMVCSIRGDEEMRDFSVTNINGDSIWLIRTIKQLTKSISYDSDTVKGPYTSTNSANNIRVELKRRGCMVTCKITMIAQFPGSGEYGPFNEVKIPVGYRPVMDFFAPYSEVSGPNIFGTGRYGIRKDGGIKIYVENAAFTERHATFTWITDD